MPDMKDLAKLAAVRSIEFESCMWGGSRPKKTVVLSNCGSMGVLRKKCEKKHKHSSWGVYKDKYSGWQFPTAEECEYPKELCQAMAKAVTLATGPVKSLPRGLRAKRKTSQATLFASATLGTQKKRFARPDSTQDLNEAIGCR